MALSDNSALSDPLQRFGVLRVALLDEDARTAQTTRTLLSTVGINQVHLCRTPDEMMEKLQDLAIDIVLVDVSSGKEEALEFIRDLRAKGGPASLIPLITLTQDTTAKMLREVFDAGASEAIAKPANARSLFSRLQSIIDTPRNFIVSKNFKGPDRRRKSAVEGKAELRGQRVPQILQRGDYDGSEVEGPRVVLPDFSLKLKVNESIPGITKSKMENEFIFWALSDVATLETAFQMLEEQPSHAAAMTERIVAASLSIQARANAYQYMLAVKVASLLYDFCRQYFDAKNPQHRMILDKHIATLSVIFHRRLSGDGGRTGQELLDELATLVRKFVAD